MPDIDINKFEEKSCKVLRDNKKNRTFAPENFKTAVQRLFL